MEQLSGLDAAFLALDSHHLTGHVGSVQVLEAIDPGGHQLTLRRLRDLVAQRMHLVPPMRRRVADVPFGLGQPYWLQARDTDLEFHVRELTLPSPGTMLELGNEVGRIHSRPLDRARPLWELHLVHGVRGGRSALYAKLHHAMIDGLAGQEISAALLDPSPDGREVHPAPAPETPAPLPPAPGQQTPSEPTGLELLGRAAFSMAGQPRKLARFAADAARSAPSLIALLEARLPPDPAQASKPDGHGVQVRAPGRAPATPFNHNVSANRLVALRAVAFSAVQAVKTATGVTVNDVVLAACAGALRRWLIDENALPDNPLVAAVPVSLRRPGANGVKTGDGSFGTKASVMLATLPTDLADPPDRLRAVRQAMLLAKDHHQAIPANLIGDAFDLALPPLIGLSVWANARLRVLERAGLCNVLISNVPGSRIPLYLAGHRVLASYPVSAVVDGQGLNITVMSYLDALHVGLTADRDLVPNLHTLASYITEEIEELARLTSVP